MDIIMGSFSWEYFKDVDCGLWSFWRPQFVVLWNYTDIFYYCVHSI